MICFAVALRTECNRQESSCMPSCIHCPRFDLSSTASFSRVGATKLRQPVRAPSNEAAFTLNSSTSYHPTSRRCTLPSFDGFLIGPPGYARYQKACARGNALSLVMSSKEPALTLMCSARRRLYPIPKLLRGRSRVLAGGTVSIDCWSLEIESSTRISVVDDGAAVSVSLMVSEAASRYCA